MSIIYELHGDGVTDNRASLFLILNNTTEVVLADQAISLVRRDREKDKHDGKVAVPCGRAWLTHSTRFTFVTEILRDISFHG